MAGEEEKSVNLWGRNVRVSHLNTVLVSLALLTSPSAADIFVVRSPNRMGKYMNVDTIIEYNNIRMRDYEYFLNDKEAIDPHNQRLNTDIH